MKKLSILLILVVMLSVVTGCVLGEESAETTLEQTETVLTHTETTVSTETAESPEITIVPETTKVPETTSAPETTSVHETTVTTEETTAAPHVHTYGAWTETQNPTCTVVGEKARTCSCGEKEIASIDALGHTEIVDKGVEATCTTPGLSEGKHCSTCNAVTIKQQYVPALGHSEVILSAVAPTCTQEGKTEGKICNRCQATFVFQTQIPATGHSEVVDKAVAPTCTLTGVTEGKHCSVCNLVIVAQTTVDALGHTEVIDKAVAATCTTSGKTEGKHCSKCNLIILSQNNISATGHKYNSGIITKPATCTGDGQKTYTCTNKNCKDSYTEAFKATAYSATELYDLSVKYVGEIITYDKLGKELALGTGFVYSSDGKIITNYHVIEDAYSATITVNGKTYNIVSVLAYDEDIDLAVLKVNASNLISANICKQPTKTGENIYAIGSSRGLTNTFSQGIITQSNRIIDGIAYIQHDASITHGNSGGPLINIYGEVIGINTWGISDSQNLNFAVFTSELDNLVYGKPMTVAEFYEFNNGAYDKLVDFIIANGKYNSSTGNIMLSLKEDYDSVNAQHYSYEIAYDAEDDCIDMYYYVAFTGTDTTFFTGMTIRRNADKYFYSSVRREAGNMTNKMSGYIINETFDDNTLVGYNSYEGKGSERDFTRENASIAVTNIILWLEWLAENYLDSTVADFGFVSF